jgi:hypothetical protein
MTDKKLIELEAYKAAVRGLIKRAVKEWKSEPRPLVFTLSLMCSPRDYSGWTAIAIDTRTNSIACCKRNQEWCKKQVATAKRGWLDTSTKKGAKTLMERECNPADFAFPRLIECEHGEEFAAWQEVDEWIENAQEEDRGYKTKKKVRDRGLADLEKVHIELREELMDAFSKLGLEPDAECGISSERDWYDHRVKFSERKR